MIQGKKLHGLFCVALMVSSISIFSIYSTAAETSIPVANSEASITVNKSDVKAILERAQPLIEEFSGLKFKKAVDFKLVDRAAFRDSMAEELLPILKTSMKGADDDTIARQVEMASTAYSQRLLGLYSPGEKRLLVVPENATVQAEIYEIDEKDFQDFLFLYITYRLLGAFEDQQFGLKDAGDNAESGEAAEAVRAVSEGYSVYVFNKITDYLKIGEPLKTKVLKSISGITDETNQAQQQNFKLIFEKGAEFMEAVLEKDGLPGIKQVFESPPVSTRQILNPEEYFSVSETTVFEYSKLMEKASELLPTDGLQLQSSELGTSTLAMLLVSQGLSQQEANKIAGGCLGGALILAGKQSPKPVMVTATVLDFQTGNACMDYFNTVRKIEKSSRDQFNAMLNTELKVVASEDLTLDGFDTVKYQHVETKVDEQTTITFSAEGIVGGIYLSVAFVNPEQEQNQKTMMEYLSKINKERLSMM